jgi:hypothetical protein
MARVAKRFMPISCGSTPEGEDDLTDSMVRWFKRIADDANDFLEFVRCGV